MDNITGKVIRFLRSNVAFLIWMAICFGVYLLVFFQALNVLAFVVVLHLISLCVAFSPVGEWFMRVRDKARKIEIASEANYIMPLFNEVYEEALKKYPNLSKRIQLYIKDDTSVNGYAYGSNTIVITCGSPEMMDEEQLKGLFAHEFGHIAGGDTKMLLALVIGNGFFSVFYIIASLLVWGLNYFIKDNEKFLYVRIPLQIIRFVFVKFILLIQLLSAALIALGQRGNEYRADEFACEIGYREHILSVLYLLHEMNMTHSQSLAEKLVSTHPLTPKRIARLEQEQAEACAE
jgi:heat shock protein HtpX